MANLDDFVNTYLMDRHTTNEDNFRNSGGEVIIFKGDGSFIDMGLGIFHNLKQFYDKPVQSQDSQLYQFLSRTFGDEIFKVGLMDRFGDIITEGLVLMTPDEKTHQNIMREVEQLHTNYNGYETRLRAEIANIDERLPNFNEVGKRIARVKDATTPSNLMISIFRECEGMHNEIVEYLPAWAWNVFSRELPLGHDEVLQSYHGLRNACKNGTYEFSISESARSSNFIMRAMIDFPSGTKYLFITDTPKDINGILNIRSDWEGQHFLYRGPLNNDMNKVISKLREKNTVVCGNIQGPVEYKKMVKQAEKS